MVEMTESGGEKWLAHIGQAWGWLLGMGVISVLIGLVALVFPGPTLLAIAILFGIQLIALAIFRFVEAIAAQSVWSKPVDVLLAVVAVVVGIYLVRHPFLSVLILSVLLGIFWIANGLLDLFLAASDSRLPARGWLTAGAVLSIIAGAFVLFFPGLSMLALTVVLGVWLIAYGLILITRAIRLRSAAEGTRAHPQGRISAT